MMLRSRRTLSELWNGRGKTGGDQSRSGYDFMISTELLRLRVPEGEAVAALLARPGVHRRDREYARRTVAEAARRVR